MDATSGQRTRYWDACLTPDFAEVSLGEGATENFREEPRRPLPPPLHAQGGVPERQARRPACVGCGRCSAACTADIADPVKVINRIMAS